MHDLVISGGTIVDGLGTPAYRGDIAISEGRLISVGGTAGPARERIDANGLIVTPGFVDIHTHYDGQATWDAMLVPSCWHGVTTALFGNCGVGFAPVRAEHRQRLIELMEGVEEIPGLTLAAGLDWQWQTFPEYLDVLERLPRAFDIGAQVPHHALRVYVMGERGLRREPATGEDIARMRELTEEALRAGAFGFTTSRTNAHKTRAGEMVPARNAERDELVEIGLALGAVGHGAFGMLTDFDDVDDEFAWMTDLSIRTGRPVYFLLGQSTRDPAGWRKMLRRVQHSREKGGHVHAMVGGRPVGVLLGIDTELNPFSIRPSYEPLLQLPVGERLKQLRCPDVRAKILADSPSPALLARFSALRQVITERWDLLFVMGDELDYEPGPENSVAAIAAQQGRMPEDVAYDVITASEDSFLFFPISGYAEGDHEVIRAMIEDEGTILGLSDAGAHCGSIVDASLPSYMISHWARDRIRGPRLPLERVVQMQTSETAHFYGLYDRGALVPGRRADINVIDLDKLTLGLPEMKYDLPAGGRRLVQRSRGYRATIVAGQITFEHGEHTGRMPGKLVRAGNLSII
ncbi:N-acyl-D-amino-acid deacylase family protein [Rhizorhabdus dicambivorans]|uniref:Amidohydrolase n=1 Tax=Rhizorhabdus dicambivorans TaxID=1850238 RepID=A0A2A4FXT1_9SPHN|nr:amidohydrolase family protein [Rhizorhabdus dicambivorans]ATE64188.1 amidohydrolase [Rhizorhabdus dicambivorans]PCE42540.1 amidohydrolase [Rhizorhabdus dicambivorans]